MIDLTDAACRYGNPEQWFTDNRRDHADCLTTCQACPVLAQCRTETLAEELVTPGRLYGFRGGLTAKARTALRTEARKAMA